MKKAIKGTDLSASVTKLPKDKWGDWEIVIYDSNGNILECIGILGTKRDAEHELQSALRYILSKK
jgi:hypothetical protein